MTSELELTAPPEGTEGLVTVDSHDPTIDPLNTGFAWYKATRSLSEEHQTGGHKWTISGHDMQILTSTVPPHEQVVTEVGSFMYMHPRMTNEVELTLCSSRGCSEGCSRILGGESCVKVYLKNNTDEETFVGLTPNFPAKVIPIKFGENVKIGSSLIAQGGAIMSQMGDVDVGFSLDCSPTTCCCAGMGIFRQKISLGQGGTGGVAFLAAGGTILQKELDQYERIIVDGGSVVAYEDTVQLGITPSGALCMCCLGGEGCFNTTLTGPGKIWLQSMNFYRFKAAVTQTIYEREGGSGGDSGGG